MFDWLKRQKAVPSPAYVPNERQSCPHCGRNDWNEERILQLKTLNPNGEYVEGYGHAIVQKQVGTEYRYRCVSCGWQEGGNPVVIDPREDSDA